MAHFFYTPMHEVTPKLVTMAVRTVMTMFRILLQSCLFSIKCVLVVIYFFSECVKIQNAYHFVIQTTIGRKNLDDIMDVTEILRFALDDKKK